MNTVVADSLRRKISDDIIRVLTWFFEVKGHENLVFRLAENNTYEEGNTELMVYVDDETTEVEYFDLNLKEPVSICIVASLGADDKILFEEFV